jgi:hypothetical protein
MHFPSFAVDTSKVAELEQSIATYGATKQELKRSHEEHVAIDNDLQDRIEVLDAERVSPFSHVPLDKTLIFLLLPVQAALVKRKEKMAEPYKILEKSKVALRTLRLPSFASVLSS